MQKHLQNIVAFTLGATRGVGPMLASVLRKLGDNGLFTGSMGTTVCKHYSWGYLRGHDLVTPFLRQLGDGVSQGGRMDEIEFKRRGMDGSESNKNGCRIAWICTDAKSEKHNRGSMLGGR